MEIEQLRSSFNAAGQGHLLQFWDTLTDVDKKNLAKELSSINLEDVNSYFKDAEQMLKTVSEKIDDHLRPLSPEVCGSVTRSDPVKLKEYEKLGLTEIGSNRVAVLLLAGGQGTRLGVAYPKGMYNVGLPSGKTLYQIQAERILRLQKLGESVTGKTCCVPWYIMTSEHTKDATETFFRNHNFFGLRPENVILFEQGLLPCLTLDGKIILETPSKVALSPDGNGGLYRALKKQKILEDMERRGIECIHVYCVDNILVKMADPVFIGFCRGKKAECGAKVVEKTIPQEAVGVVCKVNERYQVVEYSEITLSTAEKRGPDGRLVFNGGNIFNHFFTLDFLKHVCEKPQESQLKHHVAKKKIPYVDANGKAVKPDTPNGIKMEKFVFDVFQFATDRNFAVWEVIREDEFSPLKNADGAAKDTPTTCRQDLCALHLRYAISAGANFVHADGTPYTTFKGKQPSNNGDCVSTNGLEDIPVCEISPLVSYAGEGLEDLSGRKLQPPVVIEAKADGQGIDVRENVQ